MDKTTLVEGETPSGDYYGNNESEKNEATSENSTSNDRTRKVSIYSGKNPMTDTKPPDIVVNNHSIPVTESSHVNNTFDNSSGDSGVNLPKVSSSIYTISPSFPTIDNNNDPCRSNSSSGDTAAPTVTLSMYGSSQWTLKKRPSYSGLSEMAMKSIPSEYDFKQSGPKPSSHEEKKSWFYRNLCGNLSVMYVILLVTLGVIIYVWDVLEDIENPIAESFNIYLIVTQLIFMIYIHIDCRHYTNLIAKKLKKHDMKNSMDDSMDKSKFNEESARGIQMNPVDVIPQYYGFTTGRYGGSIYVKIGAAVFCFCYMIQGGLDLGQELLYYIEGNSESNADPCTSATDICMSVLELIFVFYNLFFIFKFSNLIINRRLSWSYFGIMHCIGCSLCFWIYNILQETFQSLTSHSSEHDASHDSFGNTTTTPEHHDMLNGSSYLQISEGKVLKINFECETDTLLSNTISVMAPYLYPFSIEFSILIIGIWILMIENLGKIERHTHIPSLEITYEDDDQVHKSLTSNFLISVDCHASMRGLFAGLIITVFTTIVIVLFFVLSTAEDTSENALIITAYSELVIFLLMLFSAVIVFYYLQKLDIISHSISYADDILLFACLPLIFLYAIACTVPYLGSDLVIVSIYNIIQIIQAIFQTLLICDGLRRCSNTSFLQNKKYGREFIMFLLVTNISMWLLQTFQVKSKQGNSLAYDFYGAELWTLLSHFTLPFVLYYRFHSSACLADIWMEAYVPDHVM